MKHAQARGVGPGSGAARVRRQMCSAGRRMRRPPSRCFDAFVAAGFNLIDTADLYSRWVPGHQGGGIGDDHRALVPADREPGTRWSSPPRSAWRWDRAKRACRGPYILRGRRALAPALADRPHRPLPGATSTIRPTHRSKKPLGRFAELMRQGKVAGDRGVQLLRRAAGPGPAGEAGITGCRATSCLQPHYKPLRVCLVRGKRSRPLCLKEGPWRHPLFLAREWVSSRASTARRPNLAKEPAPAPTVKKVPQRTRVSAILRALDEGGRALSARRPARGGARRGCSPARGVTAPIASATNVEQLHDPDRGDPPDARRRGDRRTQHGERVGA